MSSRAQKSGSISVRWKLAAYIAIFAGAVLLIAWVFQVFLLDTFYHRVKQMELEETADEMVQVLEGDALESLAFHAAVEHSMCVMVYRIEDALPQKVIDVDATGSNVIMTMTEKRLEAFYQKAKENGGSYLSTISFGGVEVENEDFFDKLPFAGEEDHPHRVPNRNLRMLYVRLAETESGAQFMILLDTHFQPLDSMVRTLTMQYFWIFAIVLVLAGVMVLLMYRRISAPIIHMNEDAKRLALGKYDAVFSGEGYRETRELADTLNYASSELSKLDRLQKELIANISHDLRTPLTMIKGYGEVMRDIPGENTPENIQVVIDETARLTNLVNDLLDLSKLQAGTREMNRTCFNLTLAVREVMERYEHLVGHVGYRVDFSFDSEEWVVADRGMTLQVLYNLINNAINYSGEDRRVRVRQTVEDGHVRIGVVDTGEGISPEEIPLIWERYYKVDKVHRRATVGTGLGLSIVKEIFELHGADYGVNSTKGEGSEFWFALPTVPQPKEELLEE